MDIFKDPFLSKSKNKERKVREKIGDNRDQWSFFVPATQLVLSWRCLYYLICKSVCEFQKDLVGSLLSESTNIPALFHLPLACVLRPAQGEAKGMRSGARRGLVPAIREEHRDQESPCPQLSEQELTKRGEGGCSRSQVPME